MKLNTIACSLLGVFSIAAADAKFMLLVLFVTEYIVRSNIDYLLVDALLCVCMAIVVGMVSLFSIRSDVMVSGGGVLVAVSAVDSSVVVEQVIAVANY